MKFAKVKAPHAKNFWYPRDLQPAKDVNINVNGNILTISAEQSEESGKADEEQGYRKQYRSFSQSYTLPSNVDPDQIEAQCDNGMLEVWIPKIQLADKRKVDVKSGQPSFHERKPQKTEEKANKKH